MQKLQEYTSAFIFRQFVHSHHSFIHTLAHSFIHGIYHNRDRTLQISTAPTKVKS